MNKFQVTNWSQYMRSCEHLGYFNSLDSAMSYCKHKTPHYKWQARTFEQYSEVTELDPHGNHIDTYYFVSL